MDEAPQADEYDDGPIYEDLEVLIEEVEEHKDRTSPPFQHIETPCDILDLWEHNNVNFEDNGYWTFIGPPLYDSSRPCSIVSIRCNEEELLDEVTQEEA